MNVEPLEPELELISHIQFCHFMSLDELRKLWQSDARALMVYNAIMESDYNHQQDFMLFLSKSEDELFIQYYLRLITVELECQRLKKEIKNFSFDFVEEKDTSDVSPAALYNQALIDSEEQFSARMMGCEILFEKLNLLCKKFFHKPISRNIPYPAEVNLHTFFDPEFNPQL